MLRCLRFLNAARRGGVCVFRVLQGVLDVEVFAFFECFNMYLALRCLCFFNAARGTRCGGVCVI